jgi:hypothetical protein
MSLLKTARGLQIMFAAVTDHNEEIRFEALFALKVEKYVIRLVVTGTFELSKYSEGGFRCRK